MVVTEGCNRTNAIYKLGLLLFMPCNNIICRFSRTGQWERAKIASSQITLVQPKSDLVEVTIHISYYLQMMYEVEYELMNLVHMINKRNIYGQSKTKAKIAAYWKEIESRWDIVPLVKSRYYLTISPIF